MTAPREGRAARPMTGHGMIVIRLENDPRYYEHTSIVNAVAEARRLNMIVGGTFVVYAPVRVVLSAGVNDSRTGGGFAADVRRAAP